MLKIDMDNISSAAEDKVEVCNHHLPFFFMRAIVAGFFIVVAVLLSHITAAILFPKHPEIARIFGSFLFGIAIVLIVFIGGELFTGNNMTMALGVCNKRIKIRDMLKAKGIPAKQVEMLVKMALDLGWQNLSLEELEENVNKLVSLSNF